jgi:D-xylulose reductase
MVEPLAIGMHAAKKARIKPGDLAVVIGAGTIGTVTALAALAGGCSEVIISDMKQHKLDIASKLGPIRPVNVENEKLSDAVSRITGGWGADIVFEASGGGNAAEGIFDLIRPGGCVVFIGLSGEPVPLDLGTAMGKEARMETVFRYAHVYPRAIALLGSGRIDLKPLITDIYPFERGVEAFDYAASYPPESVKVQIELAE